MREPVRQPCDKDCVHPLEPSTAPADGQHKTQRPQSHDHQETDLAKEGGLSSKRNIAQAPKLQLCGTQAEDPVKSRKLWDNTCTLWQATRFAVTITLSWKTDIDFRVPSFLLIIVIDKFCLEHHNEKDSKSAPKFNYRKGHNWLTMCTMGVDQLGLLWLQATGNITQAGLRREKELLDPAFIQEILYWNFLGSEHCSKHWS